MWMRTWESESEKEREGGGGAVRESRHKRKDRKNTKIADEKWSHKGYRELQQKNMRKG